MKVRSNPDVGAVHQEGAGDSFIGAHVDNEASKAAGVAVFVFSTEPVEVLPTAYNIRKVQDGDVLAADAETAKVCGLEWAEPKAFARASKYFRGQDIKLDDSDTPPKA